MTFPVFCLVIVPLWVVLFAIYFILKRAKLIKESLLAKCAGSFLAVSSGGVGLFLQGENPFLAPVFWFFVLCAAADVVLELNFVGGMVIFALGHGCLLVWLFTLYSPPWYSLLLGVAAYGLVWLLFRKDIPKLGKLLVPFLVYPAVLSAELAVALPIVFLVSSQLWMIALGAVCFFVSDLMVAKGVITKVSLRFHKLTMVLYWSSLFLFSMALWVS